MHFRLLLTLALTTILMAGCGAPKISPQQRTALEAPARSLEAQGEWRQAALAWQRAADANPGHLGSEFRLNAADALLQEGDGLGAAAVARKLPESLPEALALRRALTLADAALVTNDPVDALSRVGPAVTTTDPMLLARYRRIRADALELTADPLGAARERALRDSVLTDSQAIYSNRQKLWELLGQVPEEILSLQPVTPPQAESGWLELATIARRHQVDAPGLEAAINDWNLLYPGHPAGEQIIPELIEAVRVDSTPPTKVALLLPQSGPFASAAAAIRDGFMAAWFADAANPHRPEIVLRDSASGDIAGTYTSAIGDGAQFIVGPLSKEAVNAVLVGADLGNTTLTLNYPSIDESALLVAPEQGAGDTTVDVAASVASAPAASSTTTGVTGVTAEAGDETAPAKDLSRVFHFALSPEDEAARAAEHAHSRGALQAGLLVPEGAWGERIADAFTTRFEALGGVVAKRQPFPEEATGLSEAVEQLLNIGQSKERARALRGLLARGIKHEPHPRSDLDVIFLVAFPQVARQLRPLLLFHRAQDIPIVATSHVYAGEPDPTADQDIEGVVFGDMPWLLDAETYATPGQVARVWPSSGGTAGRLYAFGADAYALIARMRELRVDANASYPGLTGALSLGNDRRIRRELDWAQIRKGTPVLLKADPNGIPEWGIASRK